MMNPQFCTRCEEGERCSGWCLPATLAEIERLRTELMEVKEAWHGRCAIIDMKDDEIERLLAEQGGVAMAAEQHGRVAERAELMPEIERMREALESAGINIQQSTGKRGET